MLYNSWTAKLLFMYFQFFYSNLEYINYYNFPENEKKVYFYYENNKQIFNFKLNQIISQIHDIVKVTKK